MKNRILLLLPLLLAVLQPLRAATIVVDNTTCTLVDAVTAANNDAVAGGCSAGSGADTIELTVDITLTSIAEGDRGLPFVVSDITIAGNGFEIERSLGAPDFGLIDVAGAGTLSLNDVTLTNGHAGNGGAVRNAGTLILTETTVTDNTAGVGAIYNDAGIVTLTNSTVSGSVGGGGAIFNKDAGTVTLTNSTVSGNSGSGISNQSATVTLTNSTVSGNLGGIEISGGSATLTNSTVSGNALGGIFATSGTFTLKNTIVANSGGSNCNAAITDLGGNFDDDGSCGGGFGTITGLDPTLTDNGGSTETHALLAGSSAIGAAGACGLSTDQRGFLRDETCDSGAYEYASGGGLTRLSAGGDVDLIGTTFDGLTAFWTEFVAGGGRELFQRPIDGSSPAIPLTPGFDGFITEAQITPDDSTIVFIGGAGPDLFSVPVGGGPIVDLLAEPIAPSSIGILADSSGVLFFGPDVAFSTSATEIWLATIGSPSSAVQQTALGNDYGATTGATFAITTVDSSTVIVASDSSAGPQPDFFSRTLADAPFSVTRETFTTTTGVTSIQIADDSSTIYFTGDQALAGSSGPGILDLHRGTIGAGNGGTVMNVPMNAGGIGAEWTWLSNDGSRMGYAAERDAAGVTGIYTLSTAGPFPDPGVLLSTSGVDARPVVNFNADGELAVWQTDEAVAGERDLYGALADGSGPSYLLHDVGGGDTLGTFGGAGLPTNNQRTFYPLFVGGAPPIEFYSVRADGTEPFKSVNAPLLAGDSAWAATLPGIGRRLTVVYTGPISGGGSTVDRITVGPLRGDLPMLQANPTADLAGGENGVFAVRIAPTEDHVLFTQDPETPDLLELFVFTPDSDADGTLNPDDSCKFVAQVGQAPAPFPVQVLATTPDTFDWTTYLDVAYGKGLLPVTAAYTTTETGAIFDARSFVDEDDPAPGTGCWYLFKIDCPGGDWGKAERNAVLP